MKFKLTVEHCDNVGGERWDETNDERSVKTLPDAYQWAHATIDRFNADLRPGERPRRLVSVEIIGESETHDWSKTNLVTIMDRHGMYDKMQCDVCGITGKRFGIGGNVTRDNKYSDMKYAICVPKRSKGK